MIEVRACLYDVSEMKMFASFMATIYAQRDQADAEREREWRSRRDVVKKAAPLTAKEYWASGVVEIPEPPMASATTPTPADCEAALTAYYQKHGVEAAKAVLMRHGVARVTEEMTPEKRAALFGELTA